MRPPRASRLRSFCPACSMISVRTTSSRITENFLRNLGRSSSRADWMRSGSGFPAWSKKWVLVGNSIKNGPLYQEFCDFFQYKSICRAFPAQFQKSFTIRADLSKSVPGHHPDHICACKIRPRRLRSTKWGDGRMPKLNLQEIRFGSVAPTGDRITPDHTEKTLFPFICEAI